MSDVTDSVRAFRRIIYEKRIRKIDRMLLNLEPAPPSLRADNLIEASRRGVASVEMAELEPGGLVTAWWGGE